jgi:hypothetical protein
MVLVSMYAVVVVVATVEVMVEVTCESPVPYTMQAPTKSWHALLAASVVGVVAITGLNVIGRFLARISGSMEDD